MLYYYQEFERHYTADAYGEEQTIFTMQNTARGACRRGFFLPEGLSARDPLNKKTEEKT